MIKMTYFITCLMLMVRLRPLLRQKPLKGKSIGLLLDTQSHKQSQKKDQYATGK